MATSLMNPVFHQLRRAVLLRDGAGLTDGQLLESFVRQKNEAAFEVIVRRHGPMVLGVCRRVLGNHHDAEDAFQATFLVLVRKANSIVPREMVANWLYGVANRTALKGRSMIAKQWVRERQVKEMPEPDVAEPDHCWRDLQPLLDQELSRLPDKYRVPIVLCDLEGKTGKETARQLGWPEGTVSSRLARGRMMLAKRLTRHGLVLSGGALAVMLSQNVASASVPTSLVSTTIKAASLFATGQVVGSGVISAKVAALTEGVLKTMLLTNLKFPLMLLIVIGLAGAGIGSMSYVGAAKDQPVQGGQQQVAQVDVKQDKKPLQDNPILSSDEFLGKWAGEKDGIKVELTFTGKQAAWGKNAVWKLEYRVARKPKIPQQLPTVGIIKGVDLKCVPDLKTGRLNLYLPKYLGDDKEIKKIPAFNGRAPVGEITRGAEGTIQLRIIPTGCKKFAPEDEYPAVEGLILRRVHEPKKEGKAPDEKKPPDQVKQILDMVLKGFQAYQDSKGGDKGKKAERPDKAALDLYGEAFLKAFQLSREIAKAKSKSQAKIKPEDEPTLDAFGPAFVQAYERAKIVKKALEERKAFDGKGSDKAIEALDVFLKAGKEFEQAVKLRAKAQAVEHVMKEIERALSKVEKTAHDQRTELEALEEIEKAVKDMKKKIQGKKDRK
jgi:RNA polymerase sigma factor (sigma-70 family)